MGHYDHRVHAGNAGDVWKHFLLLEAADCLLDIDGSLVYAESHVGRPEYALRAPGDWEGGIGKIRPLMPSLRNFCYFDILADLNPRGLVTYPGSARLVWELAGRKKALLEVEAWDIDEKVAAAWLEYPEIPFLSIHLGDGFSGVASLLDEAVPGLLLIDPPYLDPEEANAAEKLFDRARELDWTVLCWYMMGKEILPQDRFHESFHEFSIQFSHIGLDYGGAKGCCVAVACPNDSLAYHMEGRIGEFLKTIHNFAASKNF
jgi:23S rRNA (adenine2030-N6)-methyltransferase